MRKLVLDYELNEVGVRVVQVDADWEGREVGRLGLGGLGGDEAFEWD